MSGISKRDAVLSVTVRIVGRRSWTRPGSVTRTSTQIGESSSTSTVMASRGDRPGDDSNVMAMRVASHGISGQYNGRAVHPRHNVARSGAADRGPSVALSSTHSTSTCISITSTTSGSSSWAST